MGTKKFSELTKAWPEERKQRVREEADKLLAEIRLRAQVEAGRELAEGIAAWLAEYPFEGTARRYTLLIESWLASLDTDEPSAPDRETVTPTGRRGDAGSTPAGGQADTDESNASGPDARGLLAQAAAEIERLLADLLKLDPSSHHLLAVIHDFLSGAPVPDPRDAALAEITGTLDRLRDILVRTANALKGEPDELSLHSWHDLPELVAADRERIAALEGALRDRNSQGWKDLRAANERITDLERQLGDVRTIVYQQKCNCSWVEDLRAALVDRLSGSQGGTKLVKVDHDEGSWDDPRCVCYRFAINPDCPIHTERSQGGSDDGENLGVALDGSGPMDATAGLGKSGETDRLPRDGGTVGTRDPSSISRSREVVPGVPTDEPDGHCPGCLMRLEDCVCRSQVVGGPVPTDEVPRPDSGKLTEAELRGLGLEPPDDSEEG